MERGAFSRMAESGPVADRQLQSQQRAKQTLLSERSHQVSLAHPPVDQNDGFRYFRSRVAYSLGH